MAHRLVFGNLDGRMRAVRELQGLGRGALPILVDMLAEREPLVREAAIDTLAKSCGWSANATTPRSN